MGSAPEQPRLLVIPATKKQLIDKLVICKPLRNTSVATLDRLRNDPTKRFSTPLQIIDRQPLWSIEQFERLVARQEKLVKQISR